MTHREALIKIAKIASESSDFSRRTQSILENALLALGFTASQRAEKHTKALMRSEAYKEACKTKSGAQARKELEEAVLADTGEQRERVRNKISETYV